MKRRKFLKIASPALLSPLVLNGLPIHTFANMDMLACDGISDRVLVVIQLNGGNDGINTLVPINQYDTYRQHRPTIGLSDSGSNAFIPLDNTLPLADQVGLHPSMTAFKSMYDNGLVNIIQGVSYDNHNRSHFKSTDLWFSGGDGRPENFNITSGWMGRYLNHTFPGMAGRPTPLMPDPLGIQLGSSKPSTGFHTGEQFSASVNLSGQDLEGFYSIVSELGGPAPQNIPQSEFGEEIEYIMGVQNSVSNYAQRITEVFNNGSNQGGYPDMGLADQLKTVARLISGGCQTKVYLLRISGFDTHANQVQQNSIHLGKHADLLSELSESVKAFLDDLELLQLDDRVMVTTFSEFGRKPIENGNFGTDHGEQAPMFVFGKNAEAGVIGTNVNLSDLNRSQLLNPQHDYRQVFTSLLQDWLGAGDDALAATYFDGYATQKLPIIQTTAVVPPECYLLTPLPAILIHFTATAIDNEAVELEWGTSTELNLERFDVERSADGRKFEPIETVNAQGNSQATQTYYLVDEQPLAGVSYYRLRQVDFDGSVQYSDIRTVEIAPAGLGQPRIFPNPARGATQLTIANESTVQAASIGVYGLDGRQLLQQSIQIKNGFNKYDIDLSSLTNGQYFVKIESDVMPLSPAIPLLVQN
ncbi:MAG: DUF1501 domain-containing protein [Bacteroidota bacterium]